MLTPTLHHKFYARIGFIATAVLIFFNFSLAQQLHLSEDGSWLSLGDLDIEGQELTVEALIWMERRPAQFNKFNIISKHHNPSNVNYLFRHSNFSITTYDHGTSGPTQHHSILIDYPYELFKLYHVATTYDGEMIRYYVNGCLYDSLSASGNLYQNDFETAIGQRYIVRDEQFYGYMDEVRIWKAVRTKDQLFQNMFSLSNPQDTSGLLAHYDFERDFQNQAQPGRFDGQEVGMPQLSANPDFDGFPIPSPSWEVNYNCEAGTASLTVIAEQGFDYTLDKLPSPNNVWSGLTTGSYTLEMTSNLECQFSFDTVIDIETFTSFSKQDSVHLCPGDSVLFFDLWLTHPQVISRTKSGGICDSMFFMKITQSSSEYLDSVYTFCGEKSWDVPFPTEFLKWTTTQDSSAQTIQSSGTYSITWADIHGCSLSESVKVNFTDEEELRFFIPNAISTNSDNINDRLQVFFNQPELVFNFELLIFDRWGNHIFKSTDLNDQWNGTVEGEKCNPGVFAYRLEFQSSSICSKETSDYRYYGTVTIIE